MQLDFALFLPDVMQMNMRVEYSEEREQAIVTVACCGERFDPAQGDNELSYMVLKQSVEELSYTYDTEREEPNESKSED